MTRRWETISSKSLRQTCDGDRSRPRRECQDHWTDQAKGSCSEGRDLEPDWLEEEDNQENSGSLSDGRVGVLC